MPHLILLPAYPGDFQPGLNEIPKLPEDLDPGDNPVPRAFPTPFAIAETVSRLLARQRWAHPTIDKYRRLALGLVLGQLEIEIVDLQTQADNFGRALVSVETSSRYFGIVCGRSGDRRVVYGGTHPACLLWPSPRRTDGEWGALQEQIQADARLPKALELLADFRDALQPFWDPMRVQWMRGLDMLIGTAKPSTGHRTLADDSHFLGPMKLWTCNQPGDPAAQLCLRRIYFPVLEPGYAKKILDMCTLDFAAAPTGGAILALDGGGQALFRIRAPAAVPGAEPLFAEAGKIEREALYTAAKGDGGLNLYGETGLFTQLSSVLQQLAADEGRALDRAYILQYPVFYPDVIRIPARAGDPTAEAETITFSAAAQQRLREGAPLPPLDGLVDPIGTTLTLQSDGPTRSAAYVEQFEGVDFSDLRSLGCLLFHYFTGQAMIRGGKPPFLLADTLQPLSTSSEGRPIDPASDLYAKVRDGGTQRDLSRRLATLQRFVASYRLHTGTSPADRLARLAAETFATWAWGSPLEALGRPASTWQQLPLPPDHLLPVCRDALLTGETQ